MGWLCVFAFVPIVKAFSPAGFGWLLAGGLIYTVGGVIYALKLPIFNSRHKNFGSHEIFHLSTKILSPSIKVGRIEPDGIHLISPTKNLIIITITTTNTTVSTVSFIAGRFFSYQCKNLFLINSVSIE